EGHAVDRAGMSLEGEDSLAGLRVPHLHRFVKASARQALAVRAEDNVEATLVVKGQEVPASCHVPYRDPPRTGVGQAFAVRAEGGEAIHTAPGWSEDMEFIAGLRIPHPHPLAPEWSADQGFAVRAEDNVKGCALEGEDLLPALRITHSHSSLAR